MSNVTTLAGSSSLPMHTLKTRKYSTFEASGKAPYPLFRTYIRRMPTGSLAGQPSFQTDTLPSVSPSPSYYSVLGQSSLIFPGTDVVTVQTVPIPTSTISSSKVSTTPISSITTHSTVSSSAHSTPTATHSAAPAPATNATQSSSSTIGVALGATAGIGILIGLFVWIFLRLRRRKQKTPPKTDKESYLNDPKLFPTTGGKPINTVGFKSIPNESTKPGAVPVPFTPEHRNAVLGRTAPTTHHYQTARAPAGPISTAAPATPQTTPQQAQQDAEAERLRQASVASEAFFNGNVYNAALAPPVPALPAQPPTTPYIAPQTHADTDIVPDGVFIIGDDEVSEPPSPVHTPHPTNQNPARILSPSSTYGPDRPVSPLPRHSSIYAPYTPGASNADAYASVTRVNPFTFENGAYRTNTPAIASRSYMSLIAGNPYGEVTPSTQPAPVNNSISQANTHPALRGLSSTQRDAIGFHGDAGTTLTGPVIIERSSIAPIRSMRTTRNTTGNGNGNGNTEGNVGGYGELDAVDAHEPRDRGDVNGTGDIGESSAGPAEMEDTSVQRVPTRAQRRKEREGLSRFTEGTR